MAQFRTRRRVLAIRGAARPIYALEWLPIAKCYRLEFKRWSSSLFIRTGMTTMHKLFKRPSGYPYTV